MYLGQSQKSLRKNWIPKDMIGSQLHQRLSTNTGRSLRLSCCAFENMWIPFHPNMATVLGRPPHPHELLKKTHTKRNYEFVDLKSKSTYVPFLTDESGSIVVLPVSAESAGLLPKRIAGAKVLEKKNLVPKRLFLYTEYELQNVGSSSASTSQPQDCSFDARVKEYVQEMKEEMKHEMREELREEMKNEMQLEMQEQADKILQKRLPILIVGLPKPPPGTLPDGTPPTGTPH
ncbi:hypothetical protein H5410_057445 [Solanum commersonii]|uniref:Uncharacterized protein n=1 Tax=Solanum commersonii TaxID=4109 RepID=A0A9J5WQ32_SOLCO|nr:hypothetical protein H5410_057445 [Solanum commersonii]